MFGLFRREKEELIFWEPPKGEEIKGELFITEIPAEKNDQIPLVLFHATPLDHKYLKNTILESGINLNRPLIFVDLPGHGQSCDIPKESNLKDLENFVLKQLKEKGISIDRYFVYGHGVFGGMIAQMVFAKDNNCIGGIFSNTSPDPIYRKIMAWNIREKFSKTLKYAFQQYEGKTDEKSMRVKFTMSLAAYFPKMNHEKAKELLDNSYRIGIEGYKTFAVNMLPFFDTKDALIKKKAPSLIIISNKDVLPRERQLVLLNALNQGELVELKENGHFPMIEDPVGYWKIVKKWLDKQKP